LKNVSKTRPSGSSPTKTANRALLPGARSSPGTTGIKITASPVSITKTAPIKESQERYPPSSCLRPSTACCPYWSASPITSPISTGYRNSGFFSASPCGRAPLSMIEVSACCLVDRSGIAPFIGL
jgi:hypothetical protein